MNDRTCWKCRRDLNVCVAPKLEAAVLQCPRCGEFTVVQAGQERRQATALEITAGVEERRRLTV